MKYTTKEIKTKSNHNIIIREAKLEDADNIKYFKEVNSSDLINLQDANSNSKKLTREEEFVIKDCIVGEDGLILIAENKNEMIGFISVLVLSEEESQNIGVLGVALIQEFRGEGIGSILIAEALQWAKNSSKLKKIILIVEIENESAIKLYKKYGFVEEGKINTAELSKENGLEQYLMGLEI